MGYGYLASPYSGSVEVMQQRYEAALRIVGILLKKREWVYSPIVHAHEIAVRYAMPRDAKFWWEYNKTMMEAAERLLVLTLPGWRESVGVAMEVEFFSPLSKPILFVNPIDAGLGERPWAAPVIPPFELHAH